MGEIILTNIRKYESTNKFVTMNQMKYSKMWNKTEIIEFEGKENNFLNFNLINYHF